MNHFWRRNSVLLLHLPLMLVGMFVGYTVLRSFDPRVGHMPGTCSSRASIGRKLSLACESAQLRRKVGAHDKLAILFHRLQNRVLALPAIAIADDRERLLPCGDLVPGRYLVQEHDLNLISPGLTKRVSASSRGAKNQPGQRRTRSPARRIGHLYGF